MGEAKRLDVWDLVAILGYFGAVIIVSIGTMFRSNRGTKEGYFLAGRFMTWLPVGASLFASNIGSEHFIGLAGSGAHSGIGVGAFELNACLLLQLLGWVFLPVYIASKVCTLPEYMNKRFGGTRIQVYLASLSLILYIFTKISVNLYSGALFIHVAAGWNIWVSILPLLVVTTFITVTGGLAAVIYTDTLQCFLMVAGGSIVMAKAFYEIGGLDGLYDSYFTSYSATALKSLQNGTHLCNEPSDQAFTMLRGLDDPDMPWLGFLLGQTPASIWYWCADQMMVQRALASRSLSHAQGATLFAGVIKLSPLFMLVIPGMISRSLYPNEVGCATEAECMAACGSPVSCSNIAYPKLVMELMPSGLRGAMLAVMLAALMSDLTSIFNSASTLFTIDIYGKIKAAIRNRSKCGTNTYIDSESASPSGSRQLTSKVHSSVLSNFEMMVVGKVFVLFMVVVSVAWVPMIQNMQGGQLYIYIQSMAADLSPPVAAVYLVAIFWKRANEQGAFWGLVAGFVIGSIRMVLDMVYRSPNCGQEDTRPGIVANFHYMYFATVLFLFTIVLIIIVSLLTEPTPESKIIRTTYWTRLDQTPRPDEESANSIMMRSIDMGRRESVSADPAEVAEEALGTSADSSTGGRSFVQANGHANHVGGDSKQGKKESKAKSLCLWILGIEISHNTTHQQNADDSFEMDRNGGRGNNYRQDKTVSSNGVAGHENGAVVQKESPSEHISSVEQDPKAKIMLYVMLIILVGVAVFFYLFFSIATRYIYPPPADM